MARPRRLHAPPLWEDETLEAHRRDAIADFISERSTEGSARYREAFAANVRLVGDLFAATNDPREFGSGRALALDPGLVRAARYLGGPPVSADDLNTLAESSIATRKRLDADLAHKAALVIEMVIDRERFPWLFEAPRRAPTRAERETAVRWTAGLQTAQEVQTKRRGESAARQEQAIERMLAALGFAKVAPRPINVTGGLSPGEFCRESNVVRVKCDIPVGLRDGRFLFVECKVSNSATNSVKRLNRETGGKASVWRREFGNRAIAAAVLAGVFKLRNLKDAQDAGVTIFWERDLGALAEFLKVAV